MSVSPEDLQEKIRARLPAGLALALEWAPEHVNFDYPEEAAQVANAIVSRQAEYLGGRVCARAAMQMLGMAPCAILNDAWRAPIWPAGLVASISHSRGLCAAIAGRTENYSALGLDLEQVGRLSEAALRRVMCPGEMERLGSEPNTGSLLFSAKEAFYKAQFGLYAASPAFHDLELSMDWAQGKLEVVGTRNLPPALAEAASRMEFRFVRADPWVVTVCWLPRG